MQNKPFAIKLHIEYRDGVKDTRYFSNHKGMDYTEAYEWVKDHPALQGFIRACGGGDYRIEDYTIVNLSEAR